MTASDDLDRYRAPALDKGLDILELLAGEEEGLSQAEIAKALGRTPNEQYRMLERLVRRGYVARNASDPSRVDVLADPYFVGGLRIFATLVQFHLRAG